MKPGRELDILVAEKVMGISMAPVHRKASYGIAPGAINYAQDHIYHPEQEPYSSDIAAAWEVVEKIRKRNFPLTLNHQGKNWWEAIFWDETDDRWKGEGSSAPHAICLAALKAVGYEF